MSVPAVLVNPPARQLGSVNAIVQGTARQYFVRDFPGPLSVKSVISGEASWTAEGRPFPLRPQTLLVLNQDEHYSLTIDSRQPVSTCCLFFRTGFIEQIRQTVTSPLSTLLDYPNGETATPVFLPRLFLTGETPASANLSSRLQAIHARIRQNIASALWMEEQMLHCGADLLLLHSETVRQAARVRALRSSTRDEVYRRLCRGREFLHGSLDQPLTLESIARAACLSPYHFHRAYVRVFGQTPAAALTALRLDRARQLLAAGSTVTDACLGSGFSSLGSFSSLFRRTTGMSPKQYRQFASQKKFVPGASC